MLMTFFEVKISDRSDSPKRAVAPAESKLFPAGVTLERRALPAFQIYK